MDDGHVRGEFGEKVGFFHGGVATSDDHELLAFKEKAVARRTGGNTMAEQAALRLEPEHLGGSAGSNYQGPRLHSFLAFDRESDRGILESHIGHIAAHEFRAEALGLRPHLFHQIGAHDGVPESRIVFHLGGGT